MEIDLLRHGRPEGGERFRGHGCDDPLEAIGWEQMQSAVDHHPSATWQLVLSSPMRRCREFAERFAHDRSLPLEIVPDLKEIGFGAWEGLSRADLLRHRAEEYQAFYLDPVRNRPPGAEALETFRARVHAALLPWLQDPVRDERLLVITHAGVIRAVLAWVLDLPGDRLYRLACGYASLSRIRGDALRGWSVEHVNHRRDNAPRP